MPTPPFSLSPSPSQPVLSPGASELPPTPSPSSKLSCQSLCPSLESAVEPFRVRKGGGEVGRGVRCECVWSSVRTKSSTRLQERPLDLPTQLISSSPGLPWTLLTPGFASVIVWTQVHLVKAMVFPVVLCGCESWTIKKAECQRIDAFEL